MAISDNPETKDNSHWASEPKIDPKNSNKNFVVMLAGNPNAGKTSIFNALTGLRYKVANYPGVTVEKKVGRVELCAWTGKGESEEKFWASLVDLPGTYSLSGDSIDEQIAVTNLCKDNRKGGDCELVVSVVDASNLERNLFLVTQIIDLGVPLIVALNMTDIAHRRGVKVRPELLSRQLGVPVVSVVARSGKGIDELKRVVANSLRSPKKDAVGRRFAWCQEGSPLLSSSRSLGRQYRDRCNGGCVACCCEGIGLRALNCSDPDREFPSIAERIAKERAELHLVGIDPLAKESEERFRWIEGVAKRSTSRLRSAPSSLTAKIDAFALHRVWGLVIFFAVMCSLFELIFSWSAWPMGVIESLMAQLSIGATWLLPQGLMRSMVTDGIIAGVGSVLVFVPQIALLYLCIGLLEDSGYLARASFLMDKTMRVFGLSGRAFIPMLSSFACAIPGILATRTIPSFEERMRAILVAPLMSCSARLPVYMLFISAFIPSERIWGFIPLQGLVLFGLYVTGIIAAALVSLLLKRSLFPKEVSLFVMEMPSYKMPSLVSSLRSVWDRVSSFIRSAGTVILGCSILLWFLASFPRASEPGDQTSPSQTLTHSYAGRIGKAIEPVIEPLGYDWRIGIALFSSFAAREVFVSSMATIFNLENAQDGNALIEDLKGDPEHGKKPKYSFATAISLMIFYVFAPQCLSTLAVCRRETGSWKWSGFMFAYMMALAYVASFAAYQGIVWLGAVLV